MPESEQHVTVTSEERVHPAIRKLARACIALARFQLHATNQPAADKKAEAAAPLPRSPETEVAP